MPFIETGGQQASPASRGSWSAGVRHLHPSIGHAHQYLTLDLLTNPSGKIASGGQQQTEYMR